MPDHIMIVFSATFVPITPCVTNVDKQMHFLLSGLTV